MGEPPALYEWAQGRPAIARLIDCFYDRVEHDDLLSPFFPGGVSAEHREHVTTWWCEVIGGPADYTNRLGGYPAMLAHHRDLGITAEQRLRFVTLMSLPACPMTRSSARRWSATWNGEPGWPCTTPSPAPTSCGRHPPPAGGGAWPRPTSHSGNPWHSPH